MTRTKANCRIATHKYRRKGSYAVLLVITDTEGATAIANGTAAIAERSLDLG
jgi:hypothetical protein